MDLKCHNMQGTEHFTLYNSYDEFKQKDWQINGRAQQPFIDDACFIQVWFGFPHLVSPITNKINWVVYL